MANKQDIIDASAVKLEEKGTKVTKEQIKDVVKALTDVTTEFLQAGEDVTWTGLYKFSRVHRPAHKGRNPKTGEEIQVPAKFAVKGKASSTLKKAVNQ